MLAEIDDTIRSEMDRSSATGLAIILVKDREVVDMAGYGIASIETKEALRSDAMSGIMSVTKPIVATAVLQMRDAGKFALDDPVNRYLAPVSIKNEWESETPVTIRQLLTHTGGLPVGTGADPPGRHPLAEYVDLAAKTSWPPGSKMIYANWGYAALGLLIERCAGEPVGDYLQGKIFTPLGMSDTVYGPPSGMHATGHFVSALDRSIHSQPVDEWPVIPTSPAGGCWSTVGDLGKFINANLSADGGVLKPETVREMHQVHAALGTQDSGMGLGFRVTRSNGRKLVCHGGDGGGFTAFAGFYPDDAVGVVLLINTGRMQTARSVIANTALRVLAEAHPHHFAGATVTPGLYRSTFWDIEVEVENEGQPTLTTTGGLVIADEVPISRLAPVSDNCYQGEGGMFHGFEVAFHTGDTPAFTGGVYPFMFERVCDIPQPEPIDEEADLTGNWRGSIRTPMGPLAVTLDIESATLGRLSTPFGPAPVEDFRASAGRVEMEFPLAIPGVGDFRNFVRLESRGGRLTGKTHARGNFGENAMRTDMERA